MTITVSSRGQVVLPAEIRRRHQIGARSKMEVLDFGKEIVLVPLPRNPFKASRGTLRGISTADLHRWRRAERRREAARDTD